MTLSSKIALGLVFIVVAARPGLAESVHLPTIDVHKLCQQDDAALRSILSDVAQDYVSVCMADEQDVREQIVKEWSTFPTLARSRCVQPEAYLPGYVEWLTCLQITRDVMKERKSNAAAHNPEVAGPSAGNDRRQQ